MHCCKSLSLRAIDIGSNLGFEKIVIVPCCVDRAIAEKLIGKKFEKYEDWIEALKKYTEQKGYKAEVYKDSVFRKEEYFVVGFR